jgi:CrcB protein
MTVLMVALGAAAGAPARYLTDRAVQSRHRSRFPWGTLTVNVLASFVLGVVIGSQARLNPDVATLVGTGFCGALSTYSTFGYETMRLQQERAYLVAAITVGLSLALGVGAGALGWWLGSLI